MRRRLFLVAFAAFVASGCGGTLTPSPITQTFSRSVFDSPTTTALPTYSIPVASTGALTGTLTWKSPTSPQPLGHAGLALLLQNAGGTNVADTESGSNVTSTLPNGFSFSFSVSPQTYELLVTPHPRERAEFFCLCDVPFSLTVTYH
jgi:hypothetical protein